MFLSGLTVFNIPPSCCNRTAICSNVLCHIPTTDAKCLAALQGVTKDTIPHGKVWNQGCSEAIIRYGIQKLCIILIDPIFVIMSYESL